MKMQGLYIFFITLALSVGSATAESLRDAVRSAVTENPRGKADRANIRAIASELDESRRSFAPQVDLFGDAGVQKRTSPTASSVNGNGDELFSREIGVRASFLLFDGYERTNQVYRNAARLDGATFRLLTTGETLALNTVEAYVDVVRHRNLVAATKSNIARHQEILRQIRERVSGGKAPASDRIQIEERVFAAEAVAAQVEVAARDAEAKYERIVGNKPRGKMHVPAVKNLPKRKNNLVANAVQGNYAIKQANKNASQFSYEREIAKAGNMPRLSLDGRATAGEDRDGTSGDETDLYVGLTLSWRLYDGGMTMARERTQAERELEAEFQRDTIVRDVTELAERAWNSYSGGLKRQVIIQRQLNSNRKIVNSYREEYELSKRSLLDVLDAERARFNASFQLINVSAAARFSAYRMLAAMSRLAQHFGVSTGVTSASSDYEERVTSSPSAIFDITIEPLQ
ncbi:MAG: TolC family outer membrane protein [Pseudomonadota bacterium]